MSSKGSPQRRRWRAQDSVWRGGERNRERGAEEQNPHVGIQIQKQGRRANRHGWSWEEIRKRVNEGFFGLRGRL